MVSVALLVLLNLAGPFLPSATLTPDAATFAIHHEGRRVGTEQFIVQPDRKTMRVAARQDMGAETRYFEGHVEPANARPLSGQLLEREPADSKLHFRVAKGIAAVTVINPRVERSREILVSDDASLFLPDFAFSYALLAPFLGPEPSTLTVADFSAERTYTLRVSAPRLDTLTVDGASLALPRYTLESDLDLRAHVWVDAEGRLFRIAVPSRAWSAIRLTMPSGGDR